MIIAWIGLAVSLFALIVAVLAYRRAGQAVSDVLDIGTTANAAMDAANAAHRRINAGSAGRQSDGG
jgi:hypothetical protein